MRFYIIFAIIGLTKLSNAFNPRVSSEFHEDRKFHDKFFSNIKSSEKSTFYNGFQNNTLDR